MGECRGCAYNDRPIYKWPCTVCRATKNGRSMYCPEEADLIANDERKTDYIIRQKIERFIENGLNNPDKEKAFGHDAVEILSEVYFMPAADVRPVVLCRDCIHRPYTVEPGKRFGFAVETPDWECKCPCYNSDDGWYSWIPDDDFFCGNGERRSEMGGVNRGAD